MDSLPRFPPMPVLPPNPNPRRRAAGHRRAHSETLLTLPDDILLDSDPNFSIADIDFSSLSDDSASASAPVSAPAPAPIPANSAGSGCRHVRSLSVDTAFFEGLALQGQPVTVKQEAKPLVQHSSSMDGLMSPPEGESKPLVSDFVRTAMPASKLAELALIDPKRAKRILANRQSAARSKERKIRYTNELERKVQTLQTEATTLSAQLTLLQRDTTGLTAENRELKLRLQAMEQQAQLREALNERLKEEVQRLKLVTGEHPNANGNGFNRGLQSTSPFFTHPQQSHNLSGHQAQQIHSLQPSSSGSSRGNQSFHDSMEFM